MNHHHHHDVTTTPGVIVNHIGGVDHGSMDHGNMDHSNMDHSNMNHGSMDHIGMHNNEIDTDTSGFHGSVNHMSGDMAMSFHFGSSETILIKDWRTEGWQSMVISCLAIFIIACLYEGLKVFREMILHRVKCCCKTELQHLPTSEEEIGLSKSATKIRNRMLSLSHLVQTLLHVMQVVLSYLLMLVFMTYNVYLCLSVALGAGLGYFLFSWKRSVVNDPNDHCH